MVGSRGAAIPVVLVMAVLSSAVSLRLSVPESGAADFGMVSGRAFLAEGTVRLLGTAPAGEPIDMSADPFCREQHDSPVMRGAVEVGPGGGLSQVLVRVRTAPATADPSLSDVLLDQQGCLYSPGVVAVRVGQTLVIRNSDATLHNVRVEPKENRGFNLGQPLAGIESKRQLDRPEIGIPVRCDIHGWMNATIHVLDHPYFDVTREDGTFTLPALPAGEYEIEAWHHTLGVSTQVVTVADGSSTDIIFEFAAP